MSHPLAVTPRELYGIVRRTVVPHWRDVIVPRQRWRAAHPGAAILGPMILAGDPRNAELGEDAYLKGPGVIIVDGLPGGAGTLRVGARSFIGEYVNLRSHDAPVVIGEDCLIGEHVDIVSTNHGMAPGELMRLQPQAGKGVVIGDDVWIGSGAHILSGARIGDHAVVAAGAVVSKEVPAGAVVGGVPARVLRYREGFAPVA